MSAKQIKVKKRVFRRMKVKLKQPCVDFQSDIKGQITHITQETCFENIVRIRRLIYPRV